ncbi:superoxide dismutase family protein [Thermomonas haemolytica]|uniref:Superoxide dismutase [Cu-Zn] n=1 Tax=Thermomonas haemolytica TaxID=141949 RepID=A0A4R3NA05_9GAMM|nr:superoxide dismutase family protein [Thermomonas haemolytica]TCT25117.1 Cu-Zn family superoxide dismutase [Thermomonas haemolytica]TNY30374.1 superoxide dismutase [Thermomonas haemolytica]
MKPIAISFATACSVLLAACASAPPPAPLPTAAATSGSAREAVTNLAAASGSLVSGRLVLVPMGDGVHLTGEIGGLPPGSSHGFHIHEKGDCSAADASSAGGHFNPDAQPHGRAGHGAHHAGDADNLVADANGVARVDVHVAGVSLGTGAANDIAGRAIIVHAAPDDYRSQPAGNAGARIACGVIRVTR